MAPDRWQRIEQLYHSALERPHSDRAAYLAAECGGDDNLRREVESLLSEGPEGGAFLERPALEVAAEQYVSAVTSDLIGRTLGRYEILSRLGAGGMGEVYRAHDRRLRRDVAIKVLPPSLAQDTERLRRFEHEARAASALNHPNIVSVHDIGSTEGLSWIVTELVEGYSLREVLAKGTMPPRKAVEIAVQIADGLAAAHAAGLVHRDLKAENVMLAPGDLVKVLDFGIAKWRVREPGTGTFPDALTKTGELVGTVTSMSPEQVEGKEVDHRSDIFSLGVLLYEMFSGKRPFRGDTHAAVMNAIVNQEPEGLPATVPEAIAGIVRRCLEKLRERRFQSAADIAYALRMAVAVHPHAEPQRKRNRWLIPAAAVTGLVLAATGTAYWWLRPERYPVDLHPVPLMSWPGQAHYPSFSPDGNRVAFEWNSEKEDKFHIYIEQIGSGMRPLQLTSSPANDYCPAWSPDDRYVAFLRVGDGATLMLVPSVGGPERRVADFPGGAKDLAWTPDSQWLATSLREAPQDPYNIWLVSVSTGERRHLTEPAAGRYGDTWPSISRDGRTIAFFREVTSFVFVPYALPLSKDFRPEGEPRELTQERYARFDGIAWTADDRAIVYSAGSAYTSGLFRSAASRRLFSSRMHYALQNATQPAIPRLGSRLVYVQRRVSENLWRLDTRTGERKMLVGSIGEAEIPQYSPNGRKLAFVSDRSGEGGVWTCDADGSNCVQLNSVGNLAGGVSRWSPDSRKIAFDSRVGGHSQIYVMQADGGGQRLLTTGPADDMIPSWSGDGRWIYFASERSGRMETWKIPVAGGAPVQVTTAGGGPTFESADGKYLYYFKFSGFGLEPAPLFRMPVRGGAEVQVLPRVAGWLAFGVAAKGVYFTPDYRTIQRLEFSTGKVTTLATVEKAGGWTGLCVSPDEAFVVWSQIDRDSAELMLVEGFR